MEALLHGNRVRLPSYMPPATHADAYNASGGLPGSYRPLQSPTMLHSPKPAPPLPLAVPLPFTPGLLLAPLSTAQSAQSLQQQPLRRMVLLVGGIPAAPVPDSQPSTARSSRVARALVPIGNMLGGGGGGGSSAAASPRQQQAQQEVELDGSSPRPCSEGYSSDSSPTKSARYGGSGPPSSAATSRLGTPRGASSRFTAEPSTLSAAAGRRPGRPLFNSARVHAASATDVPSVFESARGPELGGCSEWPGSSTGSAKQQRPSQASELRHPSKRTSGTPPHSPRPPYQPLLPAGFCEDGACLRSAAEDAAHQHMLSMPELAQCAAACSAAGVECKLVPCSSSGSGESVSGSSNSALSQPPISLHRWLRLAVTVLDSSGGGGLAAVREPPPQDGAPAVLLAPQAGCEPHMAALAVAHLMRRQGLSLYQAMVHAAAWGIDLHLGEPHLRALQLWAEGLDP